MNIFRNIAMDSLGYGASSIIARALNYAMVFFHVRWFSSSEYGMLSTFYSSAALLNILYILGMETAFFRFVHHKDFHYKKQIASIQNIVTICSLILSGIMAYSADTIACLMGGTAHEAIYIYFLCGILFFDAVSSIPFARLRLQRNVKRYVLLKMINVVVNVVVQFGCMMLIEKEALLSGSPIAYIFIANLLASVIVWILLWKDTVFYLYIDFAFAKKILTYSLPLVLGGLAAMVNETLDRVLLPYLHKEGYAIGLQQNGIYAANYKLSILITLCVQAYRMGAEPLLFRTFKQHQDAKKIYAKLMLFFVLFICIVGLVIVLFLPFWKFWIVSTQHPEYEAGLYAVPILVLANILLGCYFNLSIWYKLTKQTIYGMLFALAGAIVTVSMNICLIPIWGFWACAWSTCCSYTLMITLAFFVGRKHYRIPYPISKIVVYLLACSGIALIKITIDLYLNLSTAANFLSGIALLATISYLIYVKEIKNNTTVILGEK